MSRRDHGERRCAVCRLHRALCICGLTPRIETRTRLVLVIHRDEERKPTNSGLLAARSLLSSSVIVIGDPSRPTPEHWFRPDEAPLLLFPAPDADPIEQHAAYDAPRVLVVPDGNWRQAQKMGARIPALRDVRRVALRDGAPTAYRLRSETKPGGLATLEAIARVLRALEGERGPQVERALLDVFRVFVERTLWARGALRDDELTDGLPAAAREGVRG